MPAVIIDEMISITQTPLSGVLLCEPKVFGDDRGFFMETYQQHDFSAAGIDHTFVQDNHSRSVKHTLRGLHYQIRQPQGKLVRAVVGEIFDVAVDIRKSSPQFGQWFGALLSAENKKQLWVPPGFAHGFLTLSDVAEVLYKATDYYAPQHERAIIWNDAEIGVAWPLVSDAIPLLSGKDALGVTLSQAEVYD